MKPMLYTRWLVIAKSNKEGVSKDYKRRGNYYSAYEKGKLLLKKLKSSYGKVKSML